MSSLEKFRALNRFGLGARAGEIDRLSDPRQWLRSQVQPQLAQIRGGSLGSTQALVNRAAEIQANNRGQEARNRFRQLMRDQMGAEVDAALGQALGTNAPFAERMVRFWGNHFAISGQGEVQAAYFAGAYEREAIRPHVFGKFEDMVLASAKHPAMLIYLDQARSIGPNSRAGRNRERGLNENYARELLELHTLGVDGGYSQQDVEQLALILTGWTIGGMFTARRQSPAPFHFLANIHEPGSKTLLGRRIAEAGEAEGHQAVRMLVAHPSTANFIAQKLVRHFVSDQPNPSDVGRIARVFQATNGDLAHVTLALIDLEGAYQAGNVKIRPPQEFVIAMGRALGLTELPRQFVRVLTGLRHQIWYPQSPQGYSDKIRDWADPDSLNKRAELAQLAGARAGQRNSDAVALAQQIIQPRDPQSFYAALQSQPQGKDALALLFASPDFQWR